MARLAKICRRSMKLFLASRPSSSCLYTRSSSSSSSSSTFSTSQSWKIHGFTFLKNSQRLDCHNSGLQRRRFSSANSPESSKETISVTFVDKDGVEKTIQVPIGTSMLEAAHQNDIELEGACEGSLACSTCHVIIMDEAYYNKLSEPTDEENDMLDLAFGLTETSRLGCQVVASPELDGIRLLLPSATRNFAVDGYVPKPH